MRQCAHQVRCNIFLDANVANRWWVLALASALGLAVISFGTPIGFGVWMRRVWTREMRLVRPLRDYSFTCYILTSVIGVKKCQNLNQHRGVN